MDQKFEIGGSDKRATALNTELKLKTPSEEINSVFEQPVGTDKLPFLLHCRYFKLSIYTLPTKRYICVSCTSISC